MKLLGKFKARTRYNCPSLPKFPLIAIAVWVLSGNQLSYIVNYIGSAYFFHTRATFHVRFLSVSFKSRLIESCGKFSIFKSNEHVHHSLVKI